MSNSKKLIVAGYVAEMFTRTDVPTLGGSVTLKGFRCKMCDLTVLAETKEQVPPHECDRGSVL
ncbi:conserved hypothetical protein [Anaeromyxobacter dehalogenans 2CP-1]|uniref:Uncharacterized protein n=2 Tax=Anaeromyxobacter dehalogenans TaxID=161493 RepID=B8J6X0_ANAD2|nr:hypothetical protein [Anaeromyxobacter dehalogenans]ACL67092.1 conserved hypothetical protein [Anaeromyxobacter dehalogenans 2CP-1]